MLGEKARPHIVAAASNVEVETTDEAVLETVKSKLSSMGYPEVGDANTVIHKAKSFVSCATGRMSKEA